MAQSPPPGALSMDVQLREAAAAVQFLPPSYCASFGRPWHHSPGSQGTRGRDPSGFSDGALARCAFDVGRL